MRLIHTSDWHLGRTFGDHPLIDDQREFCDWFVGVVAESGADLVIIAGDVYDRSIPPAEAVELFSATLNRLVALGVDVVAIAGNHDSAARMAAFDGLTDAAGVFIRGGFERAGQPIVRTYPDGPLRILPLPFLSPNLVPPDWMPVPAEQPGSAPAPAPAPRSEGFGRSTRATPTDLVAHALDSAAEATAATGGTRSVVVAHDFVAGGIASDSERDLLIGGLVGIDSAAFDGHSYVALGHLHRPQLVAGNQTIRYSGSPLAYSFSEDHPKLIVQVDLDPDGAAECVEIPIPVGRRVRTVTGLFADLVATGAPLAAAPTGDDWVRVQLTDALPVPDAARQLRAAFPRLVEVEMINQVAARSNRPPLSEIRELSTAQLTERFFAEVTGTEMTQTQQTALVELIAQIDAAEATA